MTVVHPCDISIAVTGSGGVGSITAGELLLALAGNNGCFGMMRRSFGPQIRGGEAAALLRISHLPVECMNDSFDLLLALDWLNAKRFAGEIRLRPDSLIIADPAAGEVPAEIIELGVEIIQVPMKALAREAPGGRPNMVALGAIAAVCPLITAKSMEKAVVTRSPKGTGDINRKAFKAGLKAVKKIDLSSLPRSIVPDDEDEI